MKESVLVIGNGFDLAHSLKTSYRDFILNAKEYMNKDQYRNEIEQRYVELCKSNGFIKYFSKKIELENWVDVEKEIKLVINCIDEFMCGDANVVIVNGDYRIDNLENVFLRERLFDFEILSFSMFEASGKLIIEPHYYNIEHGINVNNIIEKMEQELDDFIECFEKYLILFVETNNDDVKIINQILEIDPAYIVTFNYTDTYELYKFNRENVFHIHGKIGEDNIVLGMDDDNEENLDFVAFKKYFQRIEKRTGFLNNDKFIAEITEHGTQYRDVFFYGHSLDPTDGDTIKLIKECSRTMYIFYRENSDDYKKQVKNLIAIFGKQNTIDMVQTGEITFKRIAE